jgi:ATP-binding cassette subfamily G (WHITE) protein 2
MCKGRCVYHGSAKDIVPYFSNHGYQSEPYDNPADYALDVLIDVSRKADTLARLNNIYNTTHADSLAILHQQGTLTNENIERERRKYKIEAACSCKEEIFYLSQRTLRNVVRNPSLAFSQILASIIVGLLVGLLFYDLKKTTDPGVQNRLGAIFFIVISQIFSNVTALEALLKERVLFVHVNFSYVTKRYILFNLF